MSKPKVVITAPIHEAGVELLEQHFDVAHVYDIESSQDQIDEAVAASDAVIVRSAQITGEAMRRAPHLKVIGKHGAGLDSVDVAEATRLGIVVANSGDANAAAVAEHAVTLILAALHQVPSIDLKTRECAYKRPGAIELGDLSNSVVGVLGFGNIARRVAGICGNGFGSKVLTFDPYVDATTAEASGVEKIDDLSEFLAAIDVLSIHVPLSTDTHHLIGKDRLAQLRDSSVVVNTARGGIVDEAALVQELKSGRLLAAGLDVLEHEPAQPDDEILTCPNTVLSPHIGGGSSLARERMAVYAAQAAVDVVTTHTKPNFLVNTDVLDHLRTPLQEREQ